MIKRGESIVAFVMVFMLLLSSVSYADVTGNYQNPLMKGADPTIVRGDDGYFYSGFAVNNDIYLKKAETILGVSTAKSRLVWERPTDDIEFGYVWGPYVYRIDGKWYIYFTSGQENSYGYGHPNSYVLENTSPDPFEGTWELKGEVEGKPNGFLNTEGHGLACGVVTLAGERYFTYTKYYWNDDETEFDEAPTIVKMENPWTLTGPEGTLARPMYDWERHGDNVNEGAAVVERDGKIYFAYSVSSFMNDNYAVGLSMADMDADLLDSQSWTKHPVPILSKSPENTSFGTGSPLFVKSEDGTEDWLIYHAGPVGGQTGSNRWVRAQRVHWNDDGFINLGIPSNPSTVLSRPSGEEKSEIYEAEDASVSNVERLIYSDSSKCSGGGVVAFDETSGYIEFEVEAEEAGSYALDFRFNNQGADAIDMALSVNGNDNRTLRFWNNGGEQFNYDLLNVYNVNLHKGTNIIRVNAVEDTGLVIDAMIIKRSVQYEAEEATLSNGAVFANDHTNHSGSGFVAGMWNQGATVEFDVTAPYDGNYSVKMRYANGFDSDRALSLYVNGVKIKQMQFFNFDDWDTWSDRYDNVELKKGHNTITYRYDPEDSGDMNIDFITVTEATTWHYEAENALVSGNASVQSAYSDYTGSGYVSDIQQEGDGVYFSVNVENTAMYDLNVNYMNRDSASKDLTLYVNNQLIDQVDFSSTDGWDKGMVSAYLEKGTNTIAYVYNEGNSGDVLIDSLHLNKRTPWNYEAEEGTMIGGAHRATDHLWYEGTGFVGGFENDNEGIVFNVSVPNTAEYTATLRYSGAQDNDITMSLYVNGNRIGQVALPPTEDWDSWTEKTVSVNLQSGDNTIEYRRDPGDSGRFNIDNLVIDKYRGGNTSYVEKKLASGTVYKITSKRSGKALDVARYSADPGARIDQWEYVGGNNQRWELMDDGDGFYKIRSAHSGLVIDIVPGSESDDLHQAESTDSDSQKWSLVKEGNYYKIINKANGKAMDVTNESYDNGAQIHLWDFIGSDNQLWTIGTPSTVLDFVDVEDLQLDTSDIEVDDIVTLTGQIEPKEATNQYVTWSIADAGTTQATLEGNTLSAKEAGTVILRGTVIEGLKDGSDYSKDFTITVVAPQEPTEPTDPTDPEEPTDPTDPTNPTDPTDPTDPEEPAFVDGSITPEEVDYDLASPQDVSTVISYHDATALVAVDNQGETLIEGDDYTVDNDTLTIKQSYLEGLELQAEEDITLTIVFDAGEDATWTIHGIDSTVPTDPTDPEEPAFVNGSITPEEVDYDLASPQDVSTVISYHDATALVAVDNQGEALIEGDDYTLDNDTLTIKQSYLEGLQIQAEEDITLTIVFDAGEDATWTIHGIDSTVPTEPTEPVVTYNVTVSGSYASQSGAGDYEEGDTVHIEAGSRGRYDFSGWVTTDGVTLASAGSSSTQFTMPAKNVTVSATWRYVGSPSRHDRDDDENEPDYSTDIDVTDDDGHDVDKLSVEVKVDSRQKKASIDLSREGLLMKEGEISTIRLNEMDDVEAYALDLSMDNLIDGSRKSAVEIQTKQGSVTIPSNMLSHMADSNGKKAEISFGVVDTTTLSPEVAKKVGQRPVIQLNMTIDGEAVEWNNPKAEVMVSIPYEPTEEELKNPENLVIWYINGDGEAVAIPSGHYDDTTKTVTFKTTHFSYYAIGYNGSEFDDVQEDAWYSKAVSYIVARGITDGTGHGLYSPQLALTRGQLMVMVMRAYGLEADSALTDNFDDAGDTYYTAYLATAKHMGISQGIGDNQFAPDRAVTRQEMFTLLYNTLDAINQQPTGTADVAIEAFMDEQDIADWAYEAVESLVESKTVSGTNGMIMPKSTTTRAEMAQVLYNLLTK